jgi:hypothetical protein
MSGNQPDSSVIISQELNLGMKPRTFERHALHSDKVHLDRRAHLAVHKHALLGISPSNVTSEELIF